MHPLYAESLAHMIVDERLAHAATQRRLRGPTAPRSRLRARVGAGLVRLGTRLQAHGPGAPRPVAGC